MVPDGRLRRVVVVGATGAGKSTLAGRLAQGLDVPFVELDALFWGPQWTPAAPDDFRARVDATSAGPAWVIAGNYGAVRDLLWPRADTVVWLDYPLPLVLARADRAHAPPRDHARDPVEWQSRVPALFREPAHAHARVVHLRTPRAGWEWLAVECGARAMPPRPGADP